MHVILLKPVVHDSSLFHYSTVFTLLICSPHIHTKHRLIISKSLNIFLQYISIAERGTAICQKAEKPIDLHIHNLYGLTSMYDVCLKNPVVKWINVCMTNQRTN